MNAPIKRISPSTVHSFYQCPLREVLRSNKEPTLLPFFPSARLGIAIHAVLEEAAKGNIKNMSSFEEQWSIQVGRVENIMEKLVSEKHLVPLADSERTYEVKKIRTWNMIKNEFVTPHVGNKFPSVSMEKWLESASTKVRGRIDLLIIGESGAEIIDYKTGDIIDENGNPKDEYQLQMKIYAALYHDNYSEWPKKLTIIGLNQERYNINFTPEECQKLILNLESKLDSINQIIMSIEPIFKLATPSPNACRFCMYRPSCRPYWRERNNSGDWPNDIAGRVVEMTISGIGLVRVVVENNGVRYIIRGLSKRQSLLAQNPVNIMVCNLSMDHFSGQFLENQMTMVFEEKFDISI